MPIQRYGSAIGFAIVSRCAAVFCDEPGKHLAKNRVRIFHPYLFIQLFEGNWDKVKESINEGRVCIDDVVALHEYECHAMGDFDVSTIVGVGASTVVGHTRDFRGKWIVCIRVCLAAGIVSIEGGIDGNIQEIHLFGYGGLVHLCTFAQVLKEIIEDEEVGGANTWFRWCWEGKAHTGSQGFCIRL